MSRPTRRLLAVLEMLQAQRLVSGAEMARRLGVDERTLRRHVARLEAMGVPITAERGRGGGYALVSGFKLPPMMFTDDEALALSVGLLAARGLGLADAAPAVASAQAKLERVLPATVQRRVRAIDETVALDLARPVPPAANDVLVAISAGAHERRRVRLRYRAPLGEPTERAFDPYGLVWQGGCWYAVGHCHLRRALRTFRLDRIERADRDGAPFEPPPDFDALAHLRRSIAMLPRAHAIEVWLDADLATARRQVFPAFGLLEPEPHGVRLRGQADDLDWFARELARLPFDFTVRAPAALRRALAAQAHRLARLAGRGAGPGTTRPARGRPRAGRGSKRRQAE